MSVLRDKTLRPMKVDAEMYEGREKCLLLILIKLSEKTECNSPHHLAPMQRNARDVSGASDVLVTSLSVTRPGQRVAHPDHLRRRGQGGLPVMLVAACCCQWLCVVCSAHARQKNLVPRGGVGSMVRSDFHADVAMWKVSSSWAPAGRSKQVDGEADVSGL